MDPSDCPKCNAAEWQYYTQLCASCYAWEAGGRDRSSERQREQELREWGQTAEGRQWERWFQRWRRRKDGEL